MIDSKKRTTLKALSGVTAAAIIPTSLTAAASLYNNTPSVSDALAADTELSVSMVSGHGRWHTVQLTNSSNKALTVKHVYPGLVSVDDKLFDVNSIFRTGPITVEPGKSHIGLVAQHTSSSEALEMPNNMSKKHTFTLSTQYKHFGQAMPVVTTRSYYA